MSQQLKPLVQPATHEEKALAAALADGWKEDISPATEMSNDRWYLRCPTHCPVREEILIEHYWDKVT